MPANISHRADFYGSHLHTDWVFNTQQNKIHIPLPVTWDNSVHHIGQLLLILFTMHYVYTSGHHPHLLLYNSVCHIKQLLLIYRKRIALWIPRQTFPASSPVKQSGIIRCVTLGNYCGFSENTVHYEYPGGPHLQLLL